MSALATATAAVRRQITWQVCDLLDCSNPKESNSIPSFVFLIGFLQSWRDTNILMALNLAVVDRLKKKPVLISKLAKAFPLS
ncbi:MAG: hypothetical protein CM15mP83_9440 [Flavobacteriaceae bacterium]|nr:MAG: hypothetical protein CM15mP83_9440 [Flavobacteriaceae bacterium]